MGERVENGEVPAAAAVGKGRCCGGWWGGVGWGGGGGGGLG